MSPQDFLMFSFTGPLRPGKLSAKRTVPKHIGRPDYADHPQGISACEEADSRGRSDPICLDEAAIAAMRKVCKFGREVLDLAGRAVRPGITGDDLDRIVHEACIERNCYPSPLNYRCFPKSVCTSVNEVICHGIPDSYVLQDGDIVNIDVTVYHGGYHGDLNETYYVGKPDEASRRLVIGAYKCLQAAIAQVKPGQLYRNIGNQVEATATPLGLSVVRTYCGHGIHKLFHTNPTVPHYAKNKAPGVMAAGHVFTVEPMINAGRYEDTIWPDDWTAVTKDGKRSAQFEETLLVTETGCEVLTGRPVGEEPLFLQQEKAWGDLV
jgi:methionyl aminopeptidase